MDVKKVSNRNVIDSIVLPTLINVSNMFPVTHLQGGCVFFSSSALTFLLLYIVLPAKSIISHSITKFHPKINNLIDYSKSQASRHPAINWGEEIICKPMIYLFLFPRDELIYEPDNILGNYGQMFAWLLYIEYPWKIWSIP